MRSVAYTIRNEGAGMALLDFLAGHLEISRKRAKQLLDRRCVFVNRKRVWMARHTLARGDVIEAHLLEEHEQKGGGPPDLLHQDPDYLILNKRAGVVSNGENSAESELRRRLGDPAVRAAHRLDRDTSGCLLFARNELAFDRVVSLFRRHRVRKTYHALVVGLLNTPGRTIQSPVDGEQAITKLRTLDSNRAASHLLVSIETGRTHQIRRHLSGLGHPVLGDGQYGLQAGMADAARAAPRQMLHAYSLDFRHPVTEVRVHAIAPLPGDFRELLRHLRLT